MGSVHVARSRSPFASQRLPLASQLRTAVLAGSLVALAVACASGPPPQKFEDLPSAADLYKKGTTQVAKEENSFHWFLKPDFSGAIETFQNIIDNYPYSEQAVLAQLAIGDAYYKSEKYDQALSYYRDFVELHPEHHQVPYAMFQTAMSYYKQSRDASRDQTATKEALTRSTRHRRRRRGASCGPGSASTRWASPTTTSRKTSMRRRPTATGSC
jgi:outer membrane assembly lipoprotein YfiO